MLDTTFLSLEVLSTFFTSFISLAMLVFLYILEYVQLIYKSF